MSIFKFAWRNIWRNKRRTLATVSAMTLALTVMILYSGLISGYLKGMERNILDLEIGNVQIHAGDYLENPSIYTRIENPEQALKTLDGMGFKACARLLASGLAAAGDSSAGVTMRGIDPARDREVSFVDKQVAVGTWLDESDPSGVVIGRKLARNLAVKPGGEIVILTQGADGSMANEIYKVRGVLGGVNEAVDRSGLFMLAGAFRDLMVVPEGVHQIILRKPETMSLNNASTMVSEQLPNLDVKTWKELLPTLATMLESTTGMIYVMFMIIYIAIGILILNAMLMAVFERIREFGVLKAIGMGPFKVFKLILTESIMQTTLALVTGVTLSIPGNWYLSKHGLNLTSLTGDVSVAGINFLSIMRSSVSMNTYVGPIITMICIVSISVFYPAFKAAVIKPVAAIYHR